MAKDISWCEVAPGSGIFLHEYFCSSFGPANAIAITHEDGGVAVLSPPPLHGAKADTGLAGKIRALIAPNIGHRSGLKSWVERYGELPVYTPDVVLEPLKRRGFDARPLSEFSAGAGVTVMEPKGSRTGLTFVRSTRGSRAVCYLDEVVINLSKPPKALLTRILFSLNGVSVGPRLNRFFLKALCSDSDAVMRQAREFSAHDAILVGAHGSVINKGAARLLGMDASVVETARQAAENQ